MSTTSLRRRGFGGASAAKDYIKDGLVFHLDGSDLNTVTHKWIDKVGNMTFEMSNGVTRNDAGNGAVFASGSEGHCSGGFPYSEWGGYTVTIEVVFTPVSAPVYSILSDTSGTSDSLLAIGVNTGNKIRCRRKGTQWAIPIEDTHIVSICNSYCYDNKNQIESTDSNVNNTAKNDKIWLGRQDINPNTQGARYSFVGTVYQIRIYNRVLTEDEVLYNQSIDAVKYGITLNQD